MTLGRLVRCIVQRGVEMTLTGSREEATALISNTRP